MYFSVFSSLAADFVFIPVEIGSKSYYSPISMIAYYVHDLSPFLIHFSGNIGIRYYGLAYMLGFFALLFGLRYQIKMGWLKLNLQQVDDFTFIYCLLGVLVGGRLGYCLFYSRDLFFANPLFLFKVWEGGMASHGGIFGVIVAMLWFAKKVRIPFYQIADAAALCTPVGLGLGRIANFINGELWGRPSEVPWAVIFPHAPQIMGESLPRHPSQLYEALLEGLLLFILLWIIRHRTEKTGIVALSFMAFYAIFRIFGEQFREPDIEIGYLWGGITQGQALSLGMLVMTFILVLLQRKKWRIQ